MDSFVFHAVGVTFWGMPLAMALWLSWAFRRHPRPPSWGAILLLFVAIGVSWILTLLGRAGFNYLLLLLSGAICCLVVALALGLRRIWGWPNVRAHLIPVILILPVALWLDLRFRIRVENSRGQPVEVNSRELTLSYQDYWVGYQDVHGKRLGKGTVYFGLCHWLRHKGEWNYWGNLATPDGNLVGHVEGQPSGWSVWPIRVKTNPELEQRYLSGAGAR